MRGYVFLKRSGISLWPIALYAKKNQKMNAAKYCSRANAHSPHLQIACTYIAVALKEMTT